LPRPALALALPAAPATEQPTDRPAPAPPPADGHLVLASTPEARVFIDGEDRGRTPLTVPIPPGRHFLRLTSVEGQTFEESLDVAPGARVERDRRFPGWGSLAVVSDPWMEVTIDGGAPEQTPVFLKRIEAGAHEVVGRREGFRTVSLPIEVVAGQTARLRLSPEAEARSGTEQRSISESPRAVPAP
jgi:hypothetical protein